MCDYVNTSTKEIESFLMIETEKKKKKWKEITSIYLIEKIHISAFFSPAKFSQTESSASWQQRKENMKEKMQ